MPLTSPTLREQADSMLTECRIRETLASYGEVWLFGSYDYDLMVWPEIDIRVASPQFTPAMVWEVAKDLSSVVKPTIVFIANQIDHAFGWSPENAMIMDFRFQHRDEHWKLDITFSKHDAGPDSFPLHPIVKARLTPATQALIRTIKERLIESPRYLKARWGFTDAEGNFSSYHIYTAVLRDGITTPRGVSKRDASNTVRHAICASTSRQLREFKWSCALVAERAY